MEIIMIGRGVVATIYGKAFADAGHSVRHFVRPGRKAALEKSLQIELLDGRLGKAGAGSGVASTYTARCCEELTDLASADLLFVCVRADQMAGLAAQLRTAALQKTGIVFFNNCWDDPVEIAQGLAAERILWAFPLAGGGFLGEDRLECALQNGFHLESAGGVNAGLQRAVVGLFTSIGVGTTTHSDMRAWLWRHYALNAGFLALTLSRGISMKEVITSSTDLALGLKMVAEATRVVEARGIGRKSEAGESTLVRLPTWIASGILKSVYQSSPLARRMMVTHGDSSSLAEAPNRVLDEARRLGISCPLLEAAATKIHGLAAQRD